MTADGDVELQPLTQTEYGSAKVVEVAAEVAHRSELHGYGVILLSAVFFEVASVVARAVTVYHGLTVANMVFLRGVSQLVLGLGVCVAWREHGRTFGVPRELLPLVAMRGVFGAAAMTITYKAISLVPVGVCTSLFFTNPIFTMLLSNATLGERISSREVLAALLSIGGVVLVANPTLEAPGNLSGTYVVGVCLVLCSACVVSIAFVSIRALGRRVHFLTNVLSFACCTTLIGWALGGASLPGMTRGLFIALVGCVFGFLGQCCLNYAFQHCRASTGALLRTIDVPLAYMMGLSFLGEVPHATSLLGSALVIVGIVVVGLGAVGGGGGMKSSKGEEDAG